MRQVRRLRRLDMLMHVTLMKLITKHIISMDLVSQLRRTLTQQTQPRLLSYIKREGMTQLMFTTNPQPAQKGVLNLLFLRSRKDYKTL